VPPRLLADAVVVGGFIDHDLIPPSPSPAH
jgi:hypothetical protein